MYILSHIAEGAADVTQNGSDVLVLALAGVSAIIVVAREILSYLSKQRNAGQPTTKELSIKIKDHDRRIGNIEDGDRRDQENITEARKDIAVIVALLKRTNS